MTEHPAIKVAISSDFLKAFARIPGAQQKKVREFVDRFQKDPTAPGMNYETIRNCIDPNLRSARIDQTYRAIILKPAVGNVYMLLWVDKHDDAYQWASRRKWVIHPDTGGIQVLQVADDDIATGALPAVPAATAEIGRSRIFNNFKERQLRRLGVPDELMAAVRGVCSETAFERMEGILPQEAFESLYLLTAGFSYEEVLQEYERDHQKAVDPSDFVEALDNLDSQRRFKVVEDALELQELLSAPLEQWRVFLHPCQRRVVELQANGPVRVLGGAGTGKTVVAVHRAKWLATRVFASPRDRILFTTYTRNLAADIQEYLRAICPADVLKRIDVLNLDAWVSGHLKKSGYASTIAIDEQLWRPLWENALNLKPAEYDLGDAFYRDEWNQIIQAQGISTLADYIKTTRAGRGRRLSREMKKAVWAVFQEYRALLGEHNIKEIPDAYRDCRQLLADQGDVLGYKTIVVDEGQDFGPEAFKLLRQMVPEGANDLFIVGDAHQRLYGHPVVLGQCGIKIQGRSRKLRVNYRTTDETRKFATAILRNISVDDLDGGADSNNGYRSLTHGPAPVLSVCSSQQEEALKLKNIIERLLAEGASASGICLVCRTNQLVEHYERLLREFGYKACRIVSHAAHQQVDDGIRLATMHRVKGIEFDHVIVASVNEGIIPLSQAVDNLDNEIARQEAIAKERALLYVSLTRARKSAYLTTSGTPSPLVTST